MTVRRARMKKSLAQVREDLEEPLRSALSLNLRRVECRGRLGHRSVTPIIRMGTCIPFMENQPCLTPQEDNPLNKDNEP